MENSSNNETDIGFPFLIQVAQPTTLRERTYWILNEITDELDTTNNSWK